MTVRMGTRGARAVRTITLSWSTDPRLLVILLTMTTMSLADVKARLSELVGRVQAHHERVTVTVHGRPSAVLIAVEGVEALEETLSVLSDPDTVRRWVDCAAAMARGGVGGAGGV